MVRKGYQAALTAKGVSQEHIDRQLEQMQQGESAEHFAQLESEKQQILNKLEAVAKARLLAGPEKEYLEQDNFIPHDTSNGNVLPKYTPSPLREKAKTRPQDTPPVSCSAPTTLEPYSEPLPVLYLLKPDSITTRVITLLFPHRDDNPGKRCLDWLDFVTAMAALGFREEH